MPAGGQICTFITNTLLVHDSRTMMMQAVLSKTMMQATREEVNLTGYYYILAVKR
jgi:hypothetical protein